MRNAKYHCWSFILSAGAVLAGLNNPVFAGDFVVGAGTRIEFGNARLTHTGGVLRIDGTVSAGARQLVLRDIFIGSGGVLNGDSAQFNLCGNWHNGGTFNAGASTVVIDEQCGVASVVSGDSTFANVTVESNGAKQLFFAAGSTQTVSGMLELRGKEGATLIVRSSIAGQDANLISQGSATGTFVDVDDIDASGGNAIMLDAFSVVGTSALGFITIAMTQLVQVPSLPGFGLVLLAIGMLWLGLRALVPGVGRFGSATPAAHDVHQSYLQQKSHRVAQPIYKDQQP